MKPIFHDPAHDVRAGAAGQTEAEDEKFMRLAIEQARIGDATPGAGEVGCVLVKDGEVVAAGYNEAERRHDPTAHSEIVTMRKLGEKWSATEFDGVTLYCTLQPCGMCTMACLWAKIGRIVYGATRNDVHSMYFEERHFNTADLIRDAFRDDLQVMGGVLAEECAELYYRPSDRPPAEDRKNQ